MQKHIEIIKKTLETTESTDAYLDALESVREIEKRLLEDKENIEKKDLYAQADIQNQIRKNKIDLDNQKFNILSKYTQEILPSIDNLSQCLSFVKEDDKNLKLGLEMVIQNFNKSLKRMGIETVKDGASFDPSFHEAVSFESDPSQPNNAIIKVLQQGYHIDSKIIRPSKVIVNKL